MKRNKKTLAVEAEKEQVKEAKKYGKGHCGGTPPPYVEDMQQALEESYRKPVCGVNCSCKTGEDCYGEAALNLVESLEHVSFDPDENFTIINGKQFTELEAISIANKIMNHYYTDYAD